jgi:hypothetical protein
MDAHIVLGLIGKQILLQSTDCKGRIIEYSYSNSKFAALWNMIANNLSRIPVYRYSIKMYFVC